ncbi:Cyclohexanone monooxygenase [Minicystis rosea]|nr:Cyclohexanone monooxygenase [Minicystis rosea]
MSKPTQSDLVIVGAGFAGLYMLHRARQLGLRARVFEAGAGVGGTWYWNRYPGARCDVESLDYSYSFSDELQRSWSWTERYPTQPEILRYLNHVADRFDLHRDIQLDTRVERVTYDENARTWRIETNRGDDVEARWVVMATGCLSASRIPDFKGLDRFRGATYHTGRWPHEGVDFTGRRVAVIGTGSSAIQSIPVIADAAKHVHVFQRTANFSVPAQNRPLEGAEQEQYKDNFAEHRARGRMSAGGVDYGDPPPSALVLGDEDRRREYQQRWERGGPSFMYSFGDLMSNEDANATAAAFVHEQIRSIVKNPAVAELLCPKDHPIGTKRICVDTRYYQTFNRENVTLVDIKDAPIEEITERGLRTGGKEYEVDAIVFATGFDAMTGALLGMDIRGRGGQLLRDKWAAGPRSYLGLAVSGFPNLFTVTGPGSPSVLSNMVVSIEQHVDWIADCLAHLRARGLDRIEARLEAEDAWVDHVNEVAHYTLYPKAASWYMGANVPGKPRVFMPYVGGVGAYRVKCDAVARAGYDGFVLDRAESDPGKTIEASAA